MIPCALLLNDFLKDSNSTRQIHSSWRMASLASRPVVVAATAAAAARRNTPTVSNRCRRKLHTFELQTKFAHKPAVSGKATFHESKGGRPIQVNVICHGTKNFFCKSNAKGKQERSYVSNQWVDIVRKRMTTKIYVPVPTSQFGELFSSLDNDAGCGRKLAWSEWPWMT